MVKIAIIVIAVMAMIFCADTVSAKGAEGCSQPKESGPCRARNRKFAYNAASNSCEEFNYGGCQGNDNQYDSLEECDTTCVK